LAASLRWPRARLRAAFVGAGLTFSAVTNSCTMAEVLARLPDDRVPEPAYPEVVARLSERFDPDVRTRVRADGEPAPPAAVSA
jgi:hypothetical protein